MKRIEISDADYKSLEWLGSDKWMVCTGEKPLPVEKVIHRVIEKELAVACPPRYRSIQGRED